MTTTIIPGRIAADLDADEHVLFHIGMRINRLRAVRDWWPSFMAFPRMVAELRGQPDLGLLDATSYRPGRTIVSIQHWRSVDHLHDYARGRTGAHLPAWQAFKRRSRGNGAVGLFHETYLVAPGSYETLYVGMPGGRVGGGDPRGRCRPPRPLGASASDPRGAGRARATRPAVRELRSQLASSALHEPMRSRRSRRICWRICACACRRRSSSDSSASGGTATGVPSSLTATITRYALVVWRRSPPRHGSASTRTPTSREVRPTRLTRAWTMMRSPMCTGCSKLSSSIAAVTQTTPACRAAAVPAAESTSCMITPPCTLPTALTSASVAMREKVTSEARIDRGGCSLMPAVKHLLWTSAVAMTCPDGGEASV
ncbi:DUF4188 domain-containing protein [Nitriliruptoraceae bacterium ZYF776]|nr:DUF4188 domain-containing protein [Profundirhabdus halotolerans]